MCEIQKDGEIEPKSKGALFLQDTNVTDNAKQCNYRSGTVEKAVLEIKEILAKILI